jgi:YbbR domain-containing protein
VSGLLSFLLRNWPLKLGAIALATLLYGGVVLSESVRTWPGQVPIAVLNPPENGAVLTVLEPVRSITYRGPLDATRLAPGSFQAYIDLSRVTPVAGAPEVIVPVHVNAVDESVQVVSYQPEAVRIRVDELQTRTMPVSVDRGVVPDGLDIGSPQVEPSSVRLSGAASRVMSVRRIVARVNVDASGINVDQEVVLEPLDETGELVPGVEVAPQRVRVRIAVARDLINATVPVVPDVTGAVAPGHELLGVRPSPQTVTVSGDESALSSLSFVTTEPVDVSGLSGGTTRTVELVVPSDATVNGPATVQVRIDVAAAVGARTFQLGLDLEGARSDHIYAVSTPSATATVAGPAPVLDALDPATLLAVVPVGALDVGRHEVEPSLRLPEGLALVTMAPETIVVDVTAAPSPPPSVPAAPSPGASP